MQQLDDEWQKLSIISLPFSHKDMDPEFFSRLNKLSDGTGNPPFSNFCRFMQTLLCLPQSNVDVKRIFSDVSDRSTFELPICLLVSYKCIGIDKSIILNAQQNFG